MENRFFNIKIELSMLFSFGIAVYLMVTAHNANLENAQKLNEMLVKYEHQLDSMISSDQETLKIYKENLDKAASSLSDEEKEFLLRVLELEG
ncbi:hypothetical protein ACFOD1_04740 [Pseudidiomarina halophila]|uniref:Uncharacterized protein n=1 Tax=Pseudidiomarina halophila TaxID=1449799 RepID=A0A432XZU1_9GAMM|nr:hypothetical protein [Pseudidiomarina halophila]RUO54237.1 hypothetical protein CWI69_02095 [Pseudidiomarina halophila]